MPQNSVTDALKSATSTLNQANKAFPSPKPAAAPVPKPAAAPAPKPAAGVGAELKAKSDNVAQYTSAPKMHNGGPVLRDGVYQLKKGEHVLTEPEARKAKKHALMAAGMESLSKVVPVPPQRKTAPASGVPSKQDASLKKPEKKITSGIKVRPEKNQAAQIKQPAK